MRTLCAVLILALFVSSCKEQSSPITVIGEPGIVDVQLIGAWAAQTSDGQSTGRGIVITPQGIMIPLGVEIATGKLAYIPFGDLDSIQAESGQFSMAYPAMQPSLRHKGAYLVEQDTLTFIFDTGTSPSIYMLRYRRAAIGDRIVAPIVSDNEREN